MAAGSIASGAVTITASADQLTNGLAQAGKKVETWGQSVGGKLKNLMGAGFGLKIGAGIADTLLSIPGKVLGKFNELKEGIDKASKSSRAFGTDMTTWQGIVHAADLAGVGVNELEAGLTKFRKQVDGPIDKALFDLAKRMESIQDPGERARMLVENFGKSGLKLAGLFEGGEEGLRNLVAEAEKLGFALSEADGKAIEEANDAVRRTEKAVEGLWNRLVIALAPAFQFVADTLTGWVVKFQPVFDWMRRAFTQVFEIGQAVWEAISIAVQGVFEWVMNLADGVVGFAAGMPTVQQVIVGMFRAVGTAAAYVWDVIKAGAGVVTFVASVFVDGFGLIVKVFKEVVKLAKSLPEELQPKGLDGFIEGIQRFEDGLHGAAEKMRDWGKGAVLDFGKSARDFNEWLDRALIKKKKIEKPINAPGLQAEMLVFEPFKLAGAIEKGTKEAYSLSVRNKFGEFMPPKDKVEDELKKGNKQREKGNERLGNIEKRLKELEEI